MWESSEKQGSYPARVLSWPRCGHKTARTGWSLGRGAVPVGSRIGTVLGDRSLAAGGPGPVAKVEDRFAPWRDFRPAGFGFRRETRTDRDGTVQADDRSARGSSGRAAR